MKHKPAYVVSILVPAGYVDVNLAPDKREVVLRQEAQLLETLKLSVEELYAPSRYTFRVAEGTLRGYVRDVAESQQSSSSSERALSGEEVGPVADEGLCEEIKEAESVFSDETPSDPQVSRVVAVAETLVEEIVPLPAPPAPVMSAPASSARGDSRAPLCQRVNVSVDLAKFKAIYGKQNASKRPLDSLFESPSKLRSKADVTLPSIADSPSKVLSRVLSKAVSIYYIVCSVCCTSYMSCTGLPRYADSRAVQPRIHHRRAQGRPVPARPARERREIQVRQCISPYSRYLMLECIQFRKTSRVNGYSQAAAPESAHPRGVGRGRGGHREQPRCVCGQWVPN